MVRPWYAVCGTERAYGPTDVVRKRPVLTRGLLLLGHVLGIGGGYLRLVGPDRDAESEAGCGRSGCALLSVYAIDLRYRPTSLLRDVRY
eukprot:3940643-Rhodomonas_salina.11